MERYWIMDYGTLNKNDWQAKWIGFKTKDRNKKYTLHLPASPYLRKTFKLKKDFKKATMYVTSELCFSIYRLLFGR